MKTIEENIQTQERRVSVLKGQLTSLEIKADELTITTTEENGLAIELKAKLREVGKQIKDRKEDITVPLNKALKSARELFAPLEDRIYETESIVGQKLLAYKRKMDEETRAKEAKIAERVERGTLKVETAERKLDEIQKTEKTIQTDHGKVQFRKIKKIRIVDENLIPDKYWVPDNVLIRKDLLAGIPINGCEVYEEEIV